MRAGILLLGALTPNESRGRVAEPRVPEHPITVLLAEDDDVLRRLVSQLLGNEGYRILEARDGSEALHLAHLASPHLRLVVTDVAMPQMDGWELGRRLAVDCPAVPVLYVSAYPRAEVFHRGAPGPDAPYLQKPFSAKVFLATVRDLIEGLPPALSVSTPEDAS
jgi:two-component system, cell cycle sensor histidine kinase and response regulator CckA